MTEQEIKDYLYDSTKYFPTPIEDIRIGYECEILEGFNWNKYIAPNPRKGIKNDYWLYDKILAYSAERDDAKLIRTQYLTKEQIEDEGWKEISEYNYEKVNSNITMHYGEDHYLWIMHPAKTILKEEYLANSFKGDCKSINEFRTICKLLNIN